MYVGDDYAKEISAIDKADKAGFADTMGSVEESEKAREKSAKKTTDQIRNDGGAAKDPVDKMGISDEAQEEKKSKKSE
jgi:hypothetical protein